MRKRKKGLQLICVGVLIVSLLTGCGGASADRTENSAAENDNGKKTFVLGDTTFNAENEEPNVNPHEAYAGWACMRYGIGEALFRITDSMETEPWLADSYELVDETTWRITLKDGICFSNGTACDAEAVKVCLSHLVEVHARAAADLCIASMEADGLVLTIHTSEPEPGLLNYLSEPYACIIDMEAGITEDGIVTGTGPYAAAELATDEYLKLEKNENYWAGEAKVDEITVRTISDGDTLALALQAGEIDAAYGMAYASYPLFENDAYTFFGTQTSRAFFCQMNFDSPVTSDAAVRKAIAMGIDKSGFVETLLSGYGYTGSGAFPDTFAFGGQNVTAETYDPESAKEVLEEAGWIDSDGDGIREKDGQELTIRWLTYPSRQELPLLAEYAQATLGEIGMDVEINCTADHNSISEDTSAWDVYAGANVNAGLGDPMNFFSTYCLDNSPKNRGGYHNDSLEQLARQLNVAFDETARTGLAIEMQQEILDDNAFVFCSFLQMNMIAKSNVTGLAAHPCDFYELTADLDID